MYHPSGVIRIAEIMAKYGYRAYAVGGCVRDSIMGRVPSDWDMTTDAAPEKMMEIFDLEGVRVIPTGLKHGTVTVHLSGESFEVTTFRIDGSYTDSRHPDAVTFTRSIGDDLARRDFTVNAIASDPLYGKEIASCEAGGERCSEGGFIDLYGGSEDIKRGIICAVGDPRKRFGEDALRILRAVRFAATLGFEIEEKTLVAARDLACGLQKVSAERKKTELEKTLVSNGADRGVELILELGLEGYIHAGLKKPAIPLSLLPARFETRIAAMLFENENVPELSCLKLSRTESSNIKKLCDKSRFCSEMSGENARRMLFEYGELAFDAALLHGEPELAELIKKEAINSPCVSIGQLKVSGNDLIGLGVEKRRIGEVLSHLLDRVICEPCLNQRDALLRCAADYIGARAFEDRSGG